MNVYPRFAFALLVWLACGSALAQTPRSRTDKRQPGEFIDVEELSLDDLLNVTVSIAAGRVQRLEEAPSIVSVVTDEDIRRMGARTLADVLATVPGFEVLTDGLGRNRIVVRGVGTQGESENVLILFNGHRLNDHVNGGATVANLDIPVHNLKQIEVIRGPGSALFGSNAFVGVINLVPYTTKNFSGFEVSAGAGSFNTQQYSVVTGHAIAELGLSTAFQFTDSVGPTLLVPADVQTFADRLVAPLGLRPASLAPGNTADGRRSVDFSANAAFRGLSLNARVRDEISGGFIGRVDALGTKNELDSRQLLFDVGQKIPLNRHASVTATFSFTQSESRETLNPLPPGFVRMLPNGFFVFPDGILGDFSNKSRRFAVDGVVNYEVARNSQLTVGAGFEREATFGLQNAGNYNIFTGASLSGVQPLPFTIIPDASRTVSSVFAQDTWTVSPELVLTGGVRYDRYSDFGATTNPRAALVWRLPRGLHFKGLYGRAFRAPAFTELFYNIPGAIMGNPTLRPSTIDTVEFGLGYRTKNLRVTANYFTNRIRDVILSTKPISLEGIIGSLTYVNSPGLNVQGSEFEVIRTWGFDHSVFFNYTYQRPEDSQTGVHSPDVPSNLANLGVTAGIGRHLSVSPTVRVRGARPRLAIDPRAPVSAYGLVNLNVRLKNLFNGCEISGTINNLFDRRYVDPSSFAGVPGDYPTPGRNALVTVGYKF